MPSTFSIKTPRDFDLKRDLCSYGYFLLAPNHWDVRRQQFIRTLLLANRAVTLRITQTAAGAPLKVVADATLSRGDRDAASLQLARMLRLDEDEEHVGAFHAVDPRWRASGRGRIMRSPTLFEDIIKTVTSCNVTWPSTIVMNRRLCEVLGTKSASGLFAFPSPDKLALARPQTLRARCRVGYRDARIIQLAKLYRSALSRPDTTRPANRRTPTKPAPIIDLALLQDPTTPDDVIFKSLVALPGIGPYAAANIMQLLGRYARLPLDTESVRHGRTLLGFKGSGPQVMKKVQAHFKPFGPHAFRSYWFEMWSFYESKHGPAWTWERDSTGKMFTAAQLNPKA